MLAEGDGEGEREDEENKKGDSTPNKRRVSQGLPKNIQEREVIPEGVDKHELFNEDDFDPEDIINALQMSIKETKKEYNSLHINYIEDIKQKNEAQQLLQKCIEDLKFDITKSEKDISNYSTYNMLINILEKLCANKRGFENELNAKINNMISLEKKLKILTFIYDNGFQTNNAVKNKLLVYKK